jgi:hypothetical protein
MVRTIPSSRTPEPCPSPPLPAPLPIVRVAMMVYRAFARPGVMHSLCILAGLCERRRELPARGSSMQNFRPHARLPLCFFGGSERRRKQRELAGSSRRCALSWRFRGAFGPGCWSGAARCGHRRRRRRTGGALTTPSEPKLSHRNALRARRAAVAFSRPVLGFWSDRFFNAANF